jgi:hypothetical protein
MPPVGKPMFATIAGAVAGAIGLLLPGGQLTVAGLAAAALFGTTGGVAGWKIGAALDKAQSQGIPVDELYIYEDAIHQGKVVIIALVEQPGREPDVRSILERAGAESLDQARQQWWLGLRDAEEAAYEGGPAGFTRDEALFRRGFESALSPRINGQTYEEAGAWLRSRYPHEHATPAFRRGFERGRGYRAAAGSVPAGRGAER